MNFQHVDEHNTLNLYHNEVITRIAIILPTNILTPYKPQLYLVFKARNRRRRNHHSTRMTPSSSRERGTTHWQFQKTAPEPRCLVVFLQPYEQCDMTWSPWLFTALVFQFCSCQWAGPSEACRYETACGCCMCGSEARPRSNRVVLPHLPYYKIRTMIIERYIYNRADYAKQCDLFDTLYLIFLYQFRFCHHP